MLTYIQQCQERGWNDKNHKADCKLLKDSDVHAMFTLDWDSFHDYLTFPMGNSVAASPGMADHMRVS